MKFVKMFSFALLAAVFCGMALAASPSEEDMYRQFETPKRKKLLLMQAWMDRTPDVILKQLDFLKQTFDGIARSHQSASHEHQRRHLAHRMAFRSPRRLEAPCLE